VQLLDVSRCVPGRELRGYQIKIWAVWCSRFVRVLLLDSDVVPLQNPTLLFRDAAFLRGGHLFWPDQEKYSLEQLPSEALQGEFGGIRKMSLDSGMLVIDVPKCRSGLLAAVLLQRDDALRSFLFGALHGDKNLWLLAFRAVGLDIQALPISALGLVFGRGRTVFRDSRLSLTIYYPCGERMTGGVAFLQMRPDNLSQPLFVHRVVVKWRAWDLVPRFHMVAPNRRWHVQVPAPPAVLEAERRGLHHLKSVRHLLPPEPLRLWGALLHILALLLESRCTREALPASARSLREALPLGDCVLSVSLCLGVLCLVLRVLCAVMRPVWSGHTSDSNRCGSLWARVPRAA